MAEKLKPALICWDLDHTIGEFTGMRSLSPESSSPITLRYGIRDLLTDFSEDKGYRHVITSSTNPGYINEALNRTFLNNNFSNIYGNDTVRQTAFGKHYLPVYPDYTVEEKQARMIAIGDSNKDKPIDIGGMVFVQLGGPEDPLETLVVREILTTLLDEGNGNFNEGYKKLYKKATTIENPFNRTRRILDIGNDISFTMEYRLANEMPLGSNRNVPVICNIRGDSHKKPFEKFF